MWRIEITLAMLVIAIMASSSNETAKVNCPIESENDRIHLIMAAREWGS